MIDKLIKHLQDVNNVSKETRFIRWLKDIKDSEKGLVGNKAYYLSQLYKKKYLVPNAFVLLPSAFEYFLKQNNILDKLSNILQIIISNPERLEQDANAIQQMIMNGYVPQSIKDEIFENLSYFGTDLDAENLFENKEVEIVVRVATDVEIEKPFQLTFLKLNKKEVLDAVKTIWAAMFLEENIHKFIHSPENLFKIPIILQEMVEHKRAGRITVEGTNAKIEAVRGYGIYLSNNGSPDVYHVDLTNLKIQELDVQDQQFYYTYDPLENKIVKITSSIPDQTFADSEIRDLAYMTKRICLDFKHTGVLEFLVSGEQIYVVLFIPNAEVFDESLIKRNKQMNEYNNRGEYNNHINSINQAQSVEHKQNKNVYGNSNNYTNSNTPSNDIKIKQIDPDVDFLYENYIDDANELSDDTSNNKDNTRDDIHKNAGEQKVNNTQNMQKEMLKPTSLLIKAKEDYDIRLKRSLLKLYQRYQENIELSDLKDKIETISNLEQEELIELIIKIIERI